MGMFICLVILGLLWSISSRSWKRRFVQPLASVIVAIFVFTSPAFASLLLWGLTAKLPPDLGEPVDAIVVLGRGPELRDERMIAAQQLWEEKRAPLIFVSGMMDAKFMVKHLWEVGVPESSLSGEECSQSTEENAVFSSALLHHQGVQDIILVTDSPHLRRSLMVFRSVGFNVVPHGVPLSSQAMTQRQRFNLVVREYLGILAYSLSGNFRKRSSEDHTNPPLEVMTKISEWNCKVPRGKSSTARQLSNAISNNERIESE